MQKMYFCIIKHLYIIVAFLELLLIYADSIKKNITVLLYYNLNNMLWESLMRIIWIEK